MSGVLLNTGHVAVLNFQAGKENEPKNGRYCYPTAGSDMALFRGAEFDLPASAKIGTDFLTGQIVSVDTDGKTLKLAGVADVITWPIIRGTEWNDARVKVTLADINDNIVISLGCTSLAGMPAMGDKLVAEDGKLRLAAVGEEEQYKVQMINYQFATGYGAANAAKYLVIKRVK